jgi:hypothetical protein
MYVFIYNILVGDRNNATHKKISETEVSKFLVNAISMQPNCMRCS